MQPLKSMITGGWDASEPLFELTVHDKPGVLNSPAFYHNVLVLISHFNLT